MPRGCSPSSEPSSAPVTRRLPSLVNSSNSTAVRRTLEDQKANAVWRIGPGSSCCFVLCMKKSLREDFFHHNTSTSATWTGHTGCVEQTPSLESSLISLVSDGVALP